MIRAVVFDMDGLLIDSEPYWQEAERGVFNALGIFPQAADFERTMGVRIDEVVAAWYARKPWTGPSLEAVKMQIVDRVVAIVRERGTAKAGVSELIRFFQAKELRLSIASSSLYRIIDAVVLRLGLGAAMEVLHSAEEEQRGKPAPDVFLGACRKLNVPPHECLAFEDSPNGVRSAKAAGLQCVFVPDSALKDRSVSSLADLTIASLLDFNEEMFQRLNVTAQAETA